MVPLSADTARRIGLNLLFLVPGETGGLEVYARELIPELIARAPGTRFIAFINRETAEAGWPLGDTAIVPVHSRSRAQWVAGEQALLPRLVRRHGVDLLHSLGSTAPLHGRFARVVTIHDLNYIHEPGAHFGIRSLGIRLLVPAAARTARRIIVPSRATALDTIAHLGATRDRIDVIPYGLGASATAPSDEHDARDRLGLGRRPVILSVSAKRPHKNLLRLLDAFASLRVDPRPLLVLPGYPTPHEEELRRRATDLGIGDDVRFLGWVAPADLEALYAMASIFVFPSLLEGGGLPVLEAMARDLPVACSNQSAIPEFAGDAAILFDPLRTADIAGAMERLLTDRSLADEMRRKGRAQAAAFTWAATADGTLASYRRALDGPVAP